MTQLFHPSLAAISLNKGCAQPLQVQLYESIKFLVEQKKLKPGDALPATRALGERLKIARSTVTLAYQKLTEEGWLYSVKGKGTFVSLELPNYKVKTTSAITSILKQKTLSFQATIASEAVHFKVQEQVPFALIAPDMESLPGKEWTKIVARISKSPWMHNGYCPPGGYFPFKEAICNYLRTTRAIACTPEQVLITSGIQEGLNLCSQVLFNAGQAIAVEDPSFQPHIDLLEYRQLKTIPIPVSKAGLNIGLLSSQEKIKGVLTTPCHQYPLGYSMSHENKVKLLDWAAKNGAWIIEDDYDSELRYKGAPYPALTAMDKTGSTIYLGSFTKTIYPGFNMGYMVVPKELISYFEGVKLLNSRHASEVHQTILAEFISGNFYVSHVRRLKKIYEARRNAAVRAIGKNLSTLGYLEPDNQGTHLTFIFHKNVDDQSLSLHLLNHFNLETRPLSACYKKTSPLSGLILGYAHFTEEQIELAVKCLKEGIGDFYSH